MMKPACLLALAFLSTAAPSDLLAQAAVGGASQTTLAGEVKAAHSKTIKETLKEGGIIMIPLGVISVIMFSLIGYGIGILRKRRLVPDKSVQALRGYFSLGEYDNAAAYCKFNSGFFTDVVYAGLSNIGQGKEVCERAMEDSLAKSVASLSTRFYYLNLIGVVTPMLGLTGTVLGMMRAFSTLGASGIGDPSTLAGAIGEVLVATATGLFVAIPAFTAYYIFRNWTTEATAYCEDHVNALFRGMPYQAMGGLYYGDDPMFAALPAPTQSQDLNA